jgi:hypothetical protein
MARRRAAAILLATSSVIGTVLLRRRRRQQQTRVDLYFDDGSMLALDEDALQAAPIIGAAREVLETA